MIGLCCGFGCTFSQLASSQLLKHTLSSVFFSGSSHCFLCMLPLYLFSWISSLLTLFVSWLFLFLLIVCSDRMQFKYLVCEIFLWTASIFFLQANISWCWDVITPLFCLLAAVTFSISCQLHTSVANVLICSHCGAGCSRCCKSPSSSFSDGRHFKSGYYVTVSWLYSLMTLQLMQFHWHQKQWNKVQFFLWLGNITFMQSCDFRCIRRVSQIN